MGRFGENICYIINIGNRPFIYVPFSSSCYCTLEQAAPRRSCNACQRSCCSFELGITFETLNAFAVNLFFHHVLFSTHPATMAEQNNEQKGPAVSVDPFSKQALHETSKRNPQTHMEHVMSKMEQEVLAGAYLEKNVIIISIAMWIGDRFLHIERVIAHWNKLHPDVHATHVSDYVVRLDWS
jgi:hypothetical protein